MPSTYVKCSNSGYHEDHCLLGCNATKFGGNWPMFWRNLLPVSSLSTTTTRSLFIYQAKKFTVFTTEPLFFLAPQTFFFHGACFHYKFLTMSCILMLTLVIRLYEFSSCSEKFHLQWPNLCLDYRMKWICYAQEIMRHKLLKLMIAYNQKRTSWKDYRMTEVTHIISDWSHTHTH
jgi:hypothetical protein